MGAYFQLQFNQAGATKPTPHNTAGLTPALLKFLESFTLTNGQINHAYTILQNPHRVRCVCDYDKHFWASHNVATPNKDSAPKNLTGKLFNLSKRQFVDLGAVLKALDERSQTDFSPFASVAIDPLSFLTRLSPKYMGGGDMDFAKLFPSARAFAGSWAGDLLIFSDELDMDKFNDITQNVIISVADVL